MKILFVVPYPPSLIRVRSYQLIRHLRRRGHEVTVASLWSSDSEQADLQRLADEEKVEVVAEHLAKIRSLWNTLRTVPSAVPFQSVYCWQPALARRLGEVVATQRFDIVHVEHLRGARYGLWLKQYFRNNISTVSALPASTSPASFPPPIVWDSVDCISYLFSQASEHSRSRRGRLMTRIDLSRTRNYEGWLARQFDGVFVTSSLDRDALSALPAGKHGKAPQELNLHEKLPLHVLPNGVDLDYFAPSDQLRQPATLVFSGKMSYHANTSMALYLLDEVMPRIWAQRPDVKLWIVGKDPPEELFRRCQGGPNPGSVVVTGSVPDIRPYLWQATAAVVPLLYGAGTQFKVLEAMACATPVVMTSRAAAPLQLHQRHEALIADSPEDLAGSLLDLLNSSSLCERLGKNGRRFVEQHYGWSAIVDRLVTLYEIIDLTRLPSRLDG